MRRKEGFTLIELMIVIAIIAIIAAIAIPGLLQSQRASNERNASASMKTLASAEADFRANDRDQNKVNDFWTGDVSGLYSVAPNLVTDLVKLIELSVAGADAIPLGGGAIGAVGDEVAIKNLCTQSAKAGYWYVALLNDELANLYATNTVGSGTIGALVRFNTSKFGFMTYPDTKSAGRNTFWINEDNTIYKRPVLATYVRPGAPAVPPGVYCANLVGTSPTNAWPNDTSLMSDYSKLD